MPLLSGNLVITKDTSQKIKTKGFVNNALSIFLCQSWQRLFFKAALLCKSLESLVISLYFSRKKGNGFSKLLKLYQCFCFSFMGLLLLSFCASVK